MYFEDIDGDVAAEVVPNDVLQSRSKFYVPVGRTGDVVNKKRVVPFDFIISAVGKNGINSCYCIDRRDQTRLSLRCPSVVAAKQAAKKARKSGEAGAPPAVTDVCIFRTKRERRSVQNICIWVDSFCIWCTVGGGCATTTLSVPTSYTHIQHIFDWYMYLNSTTV